MTTRTQLLFEAPNDGPFPDALTAVYDDLSLDQVTAVAIECGAFGVHVDVLRRYETDEHDEDWGLVG